MCLFTLFYFGVLTSIYFFYVKRLLDKYKRIGYNYDIQLDNVKYYILVCLGAFAGGFNGGAFALANNLTIIFALMALEVEPMVASATCGFQIVFSGAASLIQGIIRS